MIVILMIMPIANDDACEDCIGGNQADNDDGDTNDGDSSVLKNNDACEYYNGCVDSNDDDDGDTDNDDEAVIKHFDYYGGGIIKGDDEDHDALSSVAASDLHTVESPPVSSHQF
ncbi:hypothetical protein SK128_017394 [Halocaridina rubra]|uniref:Uncharacterized protein n=1 Tax=Halocaridina rubra TaxID=373956 RepID=A0AAN8WH07_HALRR